MDNKEIISTGFIALDKALGSIKSGELVVFAGRPGMGKSTMLSNICANNLLSSLQNKSTVRCAYFSFEHNIGYMYGICETTLSQNLSTPADELMAQLIDTKKLTFWENDGPDATVFYIALNAAEMKYKYGLDVIFIDSFDMLALYDGSGKAIVADRLKALAEKLNVTIFISTSIKRLAGQRSYGLEDIELQLVRLADKIIFINRLDIIATVEEMKKEGIQRGDTELIIMKNNNGSNGYIKVNFDYNNGGFHNYPPLELQ